ncbi:nuclear transport factor 2 family protein [Kitasatospora phosalacinea]|uniref:nuclear transport factor 2 family protein n=1 Tax=Kitasatospora phosalacinea TaxID=2065 RepID=UPI002555050D|nr:nuclear transport factor 2 family protein [Kitasatospora phosalacinea]
MPDHDELARRYVELWNEPDPARRRAEIDALFAPGIAHRSPTLEADGRAAMADRVAASHRKWVRDSGHEFRALPGADGHHGTVRLRWEMVHAASGERVSLGFDFLTLDADGLILSDHQFVDG